MYDINRIRNNKPREKKDKNEKVEVKLMSEEYNNHASEFLDRRDEDTNDYVLWGFILGFLLFLIIMIAIVVFTN